MAVCVAQLVATLIVVLPVSALPALAAPALCALPGNDDPAAPGGVINDYFPGTANVAAGATSIQVGAQDPNGFGATVGAGDLLIVMQMQDASINSGNSASYGNGTGSGATSVGRSGQYEYVVATGAISGGTLPVKGAGAGGGTLYSYGSSAAPNLKSFQVIRVPQYSSLPSGASYQPITWNGADGGVLALDVVNSIGNDTLSANSDGFRGGGVDVQSGSAVDTNADYADAYAQAAQGTKGEGIAGTPNAVYDGNLWAAAYPASPDSYPGGSKARGAPGNAGGGADDNHPSGNDENSGGGGGANGGNGGMGGMNWSPNGNPYSGSNLTGVNPNVGGLGGTAVPSAANQIALGGGGGSGANNNGTGGTDANSVVIGGSGGPGGGAILLRAGGSTGGVTLNANGDNGIGTLNDGAGGAGAGGSIVVTSPNALAGITASASGGTGGSAWPAQPAGATNNHGPGGGGGGGAVLFSSGVAASVTGGSNGTTTTAAIPYGSTPGGAGTTGSIAASQIPGASSGAECGLPSSVGNLSNGPHDSNPASLPKSGSDDTGSYDGNVSVSNNNDFTARSIPLNGANPAPTNTSTVPGTWAGNTVTLPSAANVNVPNELYYNNTRGKGIQVTLNATVPAGFAVRICADNAGTPDCAPATVTCSKNGPAGWFSIGSSGATSQSVYCFKKSTAAAITYWAEYTTPTQLTAFARYDALIAATDSQSPPATNDTHDELYAGFIPLTKTMTVVRTACPAGAIVPSFGACPGGVVKYSIDYRNVMAGAGQGTEAALTSAFLITSPGSLAIADDGSLSTLPNGTINNWASFSKGLKEALSAGLGNNTTCGTTANTCGDTTGGTIFSYFTGIPAAGAGSTTFPAGSPTTKFTAQIGGAGFALYPASFAGQTSAGSITFAVVVK
ncbi:MAG TPA: hypothetical protein VIG32_08290 [Candidatus Baltobacteraceae bacterium]